MSTVLWEEEVVPAAASDEDQLIPVPITVVRVAGKVEFVPDSTLDYVIAADSVSLVGSGGGPREFLLTFTLSADLIQLGYTFANPALKFFAEGSERTAGFRFSPEPSETVARASLFNTKDSHDSKTEGAFNVLLRDPKQALIVHDPAIAWDPPIGG